MIGKHKYLMLQKITLNYVLCNSAQNLPLEQSTKSLRDLSSSRYSERNCIFRSKTGRQPGAKGGGSPPAKDNIDQSVSSKQCDNFPSMQYNEKRDFKYRSEMGPKRRKGVSKCYML